MEPLTLESKKEWDDFVERSDDAWCLHLSGWLAVAESTGLHPLSFMVRDRGGQLLGIFPLFLTDERRVRGLVRQRLLVSGHGKAGPALAPELDVETRTLVFEAMFDHADTLASDVNADAFHLAFASLAPAYLPPHRPLVNPGCRFGFVTAPRYGGGPRAFPIGRFIPLCVSVDELWRGITEEGRRAIRKAERNGIAVDHVDFATSAASYHVMHVETCRRTGASPLPEDYFVKAYEALAPRGCFHHFVAWNGSTPIAAVIVLGGKGGAVYWSGSARTEALALRPNDLLHWTIIRWAKDHAYRWYETGPHFPYLSPSAKMRTIGRFKAKFGGLDLPYLEAIKVYRWGRWLAADLAEQWLHDLARLGRSALRRQPH